MFAPNHPVVAKFFRRHLVENGEIVAPGAHWAEPVIAFDSAGAAFVLGATGLVPAAEQPGFSTLVLGEAPAGSLDELAAEIVSLTSMINHKF
jgi:hypothetical protein